MVQKDTLLIIFFSVCLSAFAVRLAGAPQSDTTTEKLSLKDCIETALKHNPQITMYRKKRVQNEEKAKAVQSQYMPQVDLSWGYDYLSDVPQSKQRTIGDSGHDQQLNIHVSQPLFPDLWRITAEHTAAKRAIHVSSYSLQETIDSVVHDVKSSYYKLLYADHIVESKQELLTRIKTFYNTAYALHKRTKLPRWETLLRIDVQKNEVRQDLLTAEQNKKIGEKNLWASMGLSTNSQIETTNIDRGEITVDREKALASILNTHPALKKVNQEIKRAKTLIKVNQSGYFPRISARAGYRYEWAVLPGGDAPGGDEWSIGLGASFPLSGVLKTRANVKQAKAYYEEITTKKQHILLELKRDFDTAYLRLRTAKKRLKIAADNLKNSRQSLVLFEGRYRNGLVSVSDMLDIQKAFAAAQIKHANALLDLRLLTSELEKMKGYTYDTK